MLHKLLLAFGGCSLVIAWITAAHAVTLITPGCGMTVGKDQRMELTTITGDLDCHLISKKGAFGVKVVSNGQVDCNHHAIIGPEPDTSPPADDPYLAHVGILVKGGLGKTYGQGAHITNCEVKKWERGMEVHSHWATIDHNTLHHNQNYGAAFTGGGMFGNKVDENSYYNNYDEGIHISGKMGAFHATSTQRNCFINSAAYENTKEGWYFLAANNLYIGLTCDTTPSDAGNTASNNGADGIYLKDSHHVTIQNMRLMGDDLKVIGDSHDNTISKATLTATSAVGSRVRVEAYTTCTGTAPLPGTRTDKWPQKNTFSTICVTGSGTPVRPDYSFTLIGVANDTFTNNTYSGKSVTPRTTHVQARNRIVATPGSDCQLGGCQSTRNTTNESFNPLEVSPDKGAGNLEAESGSSVSITTGTSPACY